MSRWRYGSIHTEQAKRVEEQTAGWSEAQLRQRIADLQTQLYPFVYVLASLDDTGTRGIHATSKLWPAKFGEGENEDDFAVWSTEKKGFDWVRPDFHELHLHDYSLEESVDIRPADGRALDDSVTVIEVHQSWTGAYAYCGCIKMADVRRAAQVLKDAAPALVGSRPEGEDTRSVAEGAARQSGDTVGGATPVHPSPDRGRGHD